MGGPRSVEVVFITLLMIVLMPCLGTAKSPIVPDGGVDKERIMTRDEKLAFDKFKRNVWPHLFREDLKHDLFILRWLRAKNMNVDLAMKDFLGLKKFYYENNIETITEEEWRDFELDFPVHTATDRVGNPVSYIYLREGWDLRATILQGKRLRMERYLIKSIFDLLIRIRDSNRQNPNVTQFVVLLNLSGLNLIQQGCPVCIQTMISLLSMYERFLPGFSKEIIVVEAPVAWTIIYQAVRPALSAHTRDAIKLFDKNKSVWMPFIHKRIDPSQLPPYFGGTKNDENETR